MSVFQLDAKHFSIVDAILRSYQMEFFVFGSRSKGSSTKLSDLDLVIKQNMKSEELCKLQEAFENSDLPFKVDIILWNKTSEDFKRNIKSDLVMWPKK